MPSHVRFVEESSQELHRDGAGALVSAKKKGTGEKTRRVKGKEGLKEREKERQGEKKL